MAQKFELSIYEFNRALGWRKGIRFNDDHASIQHRNGEPIIVVTQPRDGQVHVQEFPMGPGGCNKDEALRKAQTAISTDPSEGS